jgi:hypothetical protein
VTSNPEVDQPEESPATDRRWRWLAAVSVVVCAAVYVVVARSATHPSFPFDEASMFQMSRLIAGDATPSVRGAGYFPGWAVVLAPIWWFTSDPQTFYRVGVVLGVLVSLVTIWPLSLLGRRLGLSAPQSVVAGAVVMTMPVRVIQADYLLSERLLLLLAVLAAWAAFRVAERPTWVRAPEVSLWLALGMFTHARFLPVLLAAGVWFLLLGTRHLRAGASGLLTLVLGGIAADRGGRLLNEQLLGRPFSQGDSFSRVLADMTPGLLARSVLGQSWYQLVATFGLIGIGSVGLAVLVWRELRRWEVGGGVFVLGTTAAAVLSSMLRWADARWLVDPSWVRLDVWLYGRYGDSLTVLISLIGVAAVISSAPRWRHLAGIGAAAVLCVPVLLWLAPRVPTFGFVTPAHIPGILPFWPLLPETPFPLTARIVPSFTNENRVWLVASVVVLLIMLALLALRSFPVAATLGLLVVVALASVVADPRSNRFQEDESFDLTAIDAVRELEDALGSIDIEYDTACSRGGFATAVGQNYLAFSLLPINLGDERDDVGIPTADVVVSCQDWDRADELGVRRIDAPSIYGSAFWVMPGPAQQAAAKAGLLSPR